MSESLKNLALVMYSSQLLIPPPAGQDTRTGEQQELWAASAPRIERMVPGFLDEALAPAPEPRSPSKPGSGSPAPLATVGEEGAQEEQ